MTTLLAIGTGKGLYLARSEDRTSWDLTGPHFPMNDVYAVAIDTRRSPARLLVSAHSSHFGPSVFTSDDLGASWDEPQAAPVAFPTDTGESLVRVWQLAPGPAGQPDRVYAGTQPSALFVSDDGGSSFELVRELWEHPHQPKWEAGFGGQAIHTVLPHPTDTDQVLVAMSTGGVYRTEDAGKSWTASNTGIRAYFLPDNQYPEFGQCVHKVARNSDRPDQFYAQNHHGLYRSDDGGRNWTSIAGGMPRRDNGEPVDFGFPIAAHPHRPGVVYTFPLIADGNRIPPGGKCRVYRSEDAGTTWTALGNGLPEQFHVPVLRDALCTDDADPAGVYFGSRSGEVYASADEGEHWRLVAAHLPDVLCVRAAVVG